MSKSRSFCFTVNNWTAEHIETLQSLEEEVKYLIVGDEVGEQGTPHLQGYVYFKNPRSIGGIQKVLPGHIMVARGTPRQNFEYCSKQKVILELGERPKGKGKRTDIALVKEAVAEGANASEIWEIAPSYQAYRMGLEGIKLKQEGRNWVPNVYWFWGPTGMGKTRKAVEMFPNAWISGRNLKWWEGYYGQEDVIIDDFRPDFCTFHELLRILDRYPYRVEVKGGSQQLLARNIVITCPFPPTCAYSTSENLEQLFRRLTVVEHIGTCGTGTEVGGNNTPLPEKDKEEI